MKPTLNRADIRLLKGIFPTKQDLKDSLSALEIKITKKMDSRFDDLEERIVDYSIHVESRLSKLEDEAGIPHPS